MQETTETTEVKPGPKTTPSKLKLLRNNPGKRALPENEPEPVVVIPDPPEWMDAWAVREWNRLTPHLARLGLLSHIDRGVVALNCVAWGQIEKYGQILKKKGPTYENENGVAVYSPEYHVFNKAWTQYIKTCAEIGLTPSSRTGIEVPDLPEGEEGSYSNFRQRHR